MREIKTENGLRAGLASKAETEGDHEFETTTKVFYCSRTHSQLTQFAAELRRIKLPPLSSPETDSEAPTIETVLEGIKHLTLGSRKNLCINSQVSKLGNQTAINERCTELQQSKASEARRCNYLPTKDNEPLVHQFRDHALARIRDIEDLGSLGKKIGICPYYASRAVIEPSEVWTSC